ncbi:hypothetical protein RRG08_062005 [Elysia crispata]|uniref:Uncharacterized protein n=1 Tax=Elysia crispata TaxID=231223 RepID=A0AAE1A2Y3_9GAST|nr:hypothetical protein RRG08_062005 [Elysia crispata]
MLGSRMKSHPNNHYPSLTNTEMLGSRMKSHPNNHYPSLTNTVMLGSRMKSHPNNHYPSLTNIEMLGSRMKSHPNNHYPSLTNTVMLGSRMKSHPNNHYPSLTETENVPGMLNYWYFRFDEPWVQHESLYDVGKLAQSMPMPQAIISAAQSHTFKGPVFESHLPYGALASADFVSREQRWNLPLLKTSLYTLYFLANERGDGEEIKIGKPTLSKSLRQHWCRSDFPLSKVKWAVGHQCARSVERYGPLLPPFYGTIVALFFLRGWGGLKVIPG